MMLQSSYSSIPFPKDDWERNFEKKIRKHRGFVLVLSLLAASGLFAGILGFYFLFQSGFYFVLPFSGLFLHAWMILLVHEGAHRNLTRSYLDRWILNLASALVFLPFYGEPFRKIHLYHHAHTNAADDPLWPEWKRNLFQKRRKLYVFVELIPLFSNVAAILFTKRDTADLKKVSSSVKLHSKVRSILFLCFSFSISILLYIELKPNLWFVFGSFLFANVWGSLRHWCEHTGSRSDLESNTFSFPLGMGIGNHETHHADPSLSWISLSFGLRRRIKTTGIRNCLRGIWSNPEYIHYGS
ncbi:fatty acid desaturase [Leptospira sp. 201903071]|uniref:fatty acid desaturase family protein n=1 Tax=Leptospira ainazelensis TaxID=2810034 RepID=UPI001963D4B4|nr:fatty acid desaturase [Leptospira ainazelensis]MBM9499168.1 fatty acid desaturase [Leptospira ainazelensis]